MDPPIIVFDEPFANLDYSGTRRVLEQLLALKREGRTLVLTTHDVEKAVAHADRIAVLQDGRLETAGPCDTVIPELTRYGIRPPCYALLGAGAISWLND
jgi:energy-coupling factor transporter ATP-binding protein EcfA2